MASLLADALLPALFAVLLVQLAGAAAGPALQLTKLGATLSDPQRAALKAAAESIVAGGANKWESYHKPGTLANYYAPDDNTDPRRHYASQYVRDFVYTFTMASDVPALAGNNGSDIPNILDYLLSGQDPTTGEMPEGGVPPAKPGMGCLDNGPFLAKGVGSYALLYDDLPYLCGTHPKDNATRVSKLLLGLEFLAIPMRSGQPHLVTSSGAHCMYGFTDGEHKAGHVLFASLLVVEGAQLMADALVRAATQNIRGCEADKKLEQPFLALAAAVNDTLSSSTSPLEDGSFGSGLMLATDSPGHNSQPDVWGSGLAVQIGAGTDAQRARMQQALAANASNIFRWGQARHLIWPMCWQSATPYPGFMNQNECTETGGAPGTIEHTWCGGKPCGFYQNGGYWSTPLGWLLPAVARANFTLAASLLQDALADSLKFGFNEAVNHDALYNPPQKFPPKTYQGVHSYLASVASIYGTVWTTARGAAPSTPLPPPPPPPPPGNCVDCQSACSVPPPAAKGCSNLTGTWTGTWTGNHRYSVVENVNHEVTFCSNLQKDCWSTATGPRKWDGSVHLTFKRCTPLPNINKTFYLDPDCETLKTTDGAYTRLQNDDPRASGSTQQLVYNSNPPELVVYTTSGRAHADEAVGTFDATDVLRLFGDVNRSSTAGAAFLDGLLSDAGAYSLQEKRSLLGGLDMMPTGDTGDVACQGSLNTEAIVTVGGYDALALAKKWLVTVPLDADGRVWDASNQQYHQQRQASWEAAAEFVLMARLVAAHTGDLSMFRTAPDRVLCYEDAGGNLVNAGASADAGGDALCKVAVSSLKKHLPGDMFDESVTGMPFKTRDFPRLQVAGAKRLVQRFTAQKPINALIIPLVPAKGPTAPVKICLKHVQTGSIVFSETLAFNASSQSPRGWYRLHLGSACAAGVYDLAVTAAANVVGKHMPRPAPVSWPTRTQVIQGGSRLESWGYVHADTGTPGSGTSKDDGTCCAQSSSALSANATLSAQLERGMRWQLGLAAARNGTGFGVLTVPDAFYNGVPEIGQGTCSASSMWDQIRMGYKATYINMLFLWSIDAYMELEQAGAVTPLSEVKGVMTNSAVVRAQVADDITRQLSYRTSATNQSRAEDSAGQGFYSWISCSSSNTAGISTCDRDSATGPGQVTIDAQMLPDQAYAVILGLADSAAVRARLDEMIERSRSSGLTRGGLIANNLRALEAIDPRTISSADEWNPTTKDHFCDPAADGTMIYAGHCACRNDSKVGGSRCWGNFGVNQQNGGRIFATQATVFKAGPYARAYEDFERMVLDLRAAAAQLKARDYKLPLLWNVSEGRGMLRTPITTPALRKMCMIMHHFAPGAKLDQDGWGENICNYTKDVTFGLRTGPKNALLGFAIGHLGLHVTAKGELQLYGQHVPLPASADSTRAAHRGEGGVSTLTVPLPAGSSGAAWPATMKGLVLSGVNVAGQGRFRVECNTTSAAATALKCSVAPHVTA